MHNLLYKLQDGTIVKTLAEARASGQEYKMILEATISMQTNKEV